MLGILQQHWNDILTVLAFGVSLWVAYYQVKHYRAQLPNPQLGEVTKTYYHPTAENEYGDQAATEIENAEKTRYVARAEIKNTGSDKTAIKKAKLIIPDVSEEFDGGHSKVLSGNGYESIGFSGIGKRRQGYSGDIDAEIEVETTKETLRKDIELEPKLSW